MLIGIRNPSQEIFHISFDNNESRMSCCCRRLHLGKIRKDAIMRESADEMEEDAPHFLLKIYD